MQNLLSAWLEANKKPAWISELLKIVNLGINDSRFKLGPSYFMVQDVEEDLENIWNYQILPQLHDVHFGDEKILSKYSFDTVKSQVDQK